MGVGVGKILILACAVCGLAACVDPEPFDEVMRRHRYEYCDGLLHKTENCGKW